jgi:hypothetical protein
MGYHRTGVNYSGRELDELREPVVYGDGPSGLSQSQLSWSYIAEQLSEIGMYVETSMNKNADAREGVAADAANAQGLSPLAAYAQAAQIQAEFAAEATGNQIDYYTTTRDSMPEHMDRPSLWSDILTPWEYFRKKSEYDGRVDRATDLMNTYQANSNSNIDSMPQFTTPQNANISMAITTGTQVNPGSISTATPTLPAGVGTAPASSAGGVVGLGGRGIAPIVASGGTGGYVGPSTGIGVPPGAGAPVGLPVGEVVGPGGGTGGARGGYPGAPGVGGSGGTRPGTGTTRPGTGSGRPGAGAVPGSSGTGTARPGSGSGGVARPGTSGGAERLRGGGGVGESGRSGMGRSLPGNPSTLGEDGVHRGRGGLGAGEHGLAGRGSAGPLGEHGAGRGAGGLAGEHGGTGRSASGLRGGGAGGGSAFGPMGGGARGDEDREHRTPDYLTETSDIFRDGTMVAPPVIGDERPDYYER